MTSAIIIILVIALLSACWFLFNTSCDLNVAKQTVDSQRRIIASMKNAGAELQRRDNPNPAPASDKWHWYAVLGGKTYVFTDEALKVAGERADNLLKQ